MEELLRSRPGVIATMVGYVGGVNKNPTYENHPGHAEAVAIKFDEDQTSFKDLLDFFFRIHDPTTKDRQGTIWANLIDLLFSTRTMTKRPKPKISLK